MKLTFSMKALLLLSFTCLAGVLLSHAQTSETYILKAGQNINRMYSKEIFRFPEFNQGTVVFKDGKRSDAKLNYNIWIGDMLFLHPSGDTLSIDNAYTVDYVVIGKDSFFYDKGYIERIGGASFAKLAKKVKMVLKDREKIGGYEQPTSTAAIDSYRYFVKGENQSLTVRENLVLGKRTSFYLGDRFNHFVPANRKNLLNLFSKQESSISAYLKQHAVNFNKEEDMQQLTAFLNSL